MSDKDKGVEVSNTPYLANPIEYTEEPYPSIGVRVLSPKGVGERPHLEKAKSTKSTKSTKKPAGAGAGDKTSTREN